MALSVTITGKGITRLSEAVRALGSRSAHAAYSRAINHAGKTSGTASGRALAKQTGLPAKVTRKAVTQRVTRSSPATLTYIVHGSGGNISLRHFKARETRKGVSAQPWGARKIFASTFMRAGFWPKRIVKSNWNGQVFRRRADGGFEKVKSDLYIPTELTRGATAKAWTQGTAKLQGRVNHEIRRVTKGAVT